MKEFDRHATKIVEKILKETSLLSCNWSNLDPITRNNISIKIFPYKSQNNKKRDEGYICYTWGKKYMGTLLPILKIYCHRTGHLCLILIKYCKGKLDFQL